MTYRCLLSGGGTAGSVTPLLALVDQLRPRHEHIEFLFVGTPTGPERTLVKQVGIEFMSIASGKLRRYWSWQNLRDLGRTWTGYRQAAHIVRTWKPQVAVSAGSFVSVPVIWAAHRQGVATLVHQQDIRPGLANRLMSPAADRITVTFESSTRSFPTKKVHWIGNPVRPEVRRGNEAEGRRLFHLSDQRPVLLVLGGGTGSATMNTLVGTMVDKLVEHWTVIHVTGHHRPTVDVRHPDYQRYEFLTAELPHAMAVADVVISRAGLGALSELAALGKATIFIPLPGTHQMENAERVAQAKAAIVMSESTDLQTQLFDVIERLRLDSDERRRLGQTLRQFDRPEATAAMADEVMHLLRS